jgi:hypothetical protein
MTFDRASHLTQTVAHLSHAELTAELGRLAGCEREATAALVVHLAEFDARRLYEPAGFPSLFKYCMAVLHLSEDAVYNRIEVARAVRRYPVLAEMLATGALSPTTARLVVGHLTHQNQEALLAAASFQSKQAVEELLVHVCPRPDVTARVRKIPSQPVTAADVGPPLADTTMQPEMAPRPSPPPPPCSTPTTAAPADPRALVRPRAPERYEIRFTASKEMRDELREAQDLLGHSIPSGDIAAVFARALSLLVSDLKRRKCAATTRPRPRSDPGAPATSPNVPAEVKRVVWARDRASCAFVSAHGHRCGERRFLEFHHIVPRGAGGPGTAENIALRCRAHNGHEVDLFYGPGKRWTRGDDRSRSGTSARREAGGSSAGGEGVRSASAGAG